MSNGLKFDEFDDKLQDLKQEFKEYYGKDLTTIAELESYLRMRKVKNPRKFLRSLKGFDL